MLQNLCDVHTHTLFTRHAYSTLEENVRAAADAGLELLGSADHFSDMLYGRAFDVRDFQFFFNTQAWPREWHGVRLLRGVEADIVDLEGHLFGWDVPVTEGIVGQPCKDVATLAERVLDPQDYAIASIHASDFCDGASKARTTDMYVHALENPHVLALGHTGRAGVPFDVDTVLACARSLGKLIEINEHSLADNRERSLAPCHHIAERCAEMGVSICVNTDAHISAGVGRFPAALAMLDEIGFPQELVATRSADAFVSAMHAALD
jgi:putative hydrolase